MEKSGSRAIGFRVWVFFACAVIPWVAVSADTVAPRIEHQIVSDEVSGSQPYTFEATVTDDDGVSEVVLNYRNQGASDFKALPMKASSGSAEYRVELPADAISVPGLDYFITATDNSGNQQFRGFDFDPLQLGVFAPVKLQSNDGEQQKSGGGKTAWYVVGGVALIGLVAASLGSDGGGSDPGNTTIDTIVLER